MDNMTKNKMICTSCNCEGEGKYCSRCGATMIEKPEPETIQNIETNRFCSNCGEKVESNFCIRCGSSTAGNPIALTQNNISENIKISNILEMITSGKNVAGFIGTFLMLVLMPIDLYYLLVVIISQSSFEMFCTFLLVIFSSIFIMISFFKGLKGSMKSIHRPFIGAIICSVISLFNMYFLNKFGALINFAGVICFIMEFIKMKNSTTMR